MGLQSIWNDKGDYLTKESKGFSARSTGCSCCSSELDTEAEVKHEVIDSLQYILLAAEYFKWDLDALVEKAKEADVYKHCHSNKGGAEQ